MHCKSFYFDHMIIAHDTWMANMHQPFGVTHLNESTLLHNQGSTLSIACHSIFTSLMPEFNQYFALIGKKKTKKNHLSLKEINFYHTSEISKENVSLFGLNCYSAKKSMKSVDLQTYTCNSFLLVSF
mgnify:CR=1 FL=1